ncbi:unnamed protein product [Lactuca saligna]|uniref:DC1 domain-containing protein n=1 Tax=Lactuca saligna TaxID=75948 RepID=A0AA35ZSY4_LACSI|nr:unnamed protein product [Lactuca saligna]
MQEEEEEEDIDEGGDPIIREMFQGVTCERYMEEIHMYHRYYYTCTICDDFSLHKLSGELPSRLEHPSHPSHTLYQTYHSYHRICSNCKRDQKLGELFYQCGKCDFSIDLKCAVEVGKM